jgi:hypothetical protein
MVRCVRSPSNPLIRPCASRLSVSAAANAPRGPGAVAEPSTSTAFGAARTIFGRMPSPGKCRAMPLRP